MSITVDLRGCARCHGDGHPGITFQPLTYPLESDCDDEEDFTHWAPCPTNGEPILMRFVEVPDAVASPVRGNE